MTLLLAGVVDALTTGRVAWVADPRPGPLGLGWNFGLIAGTALVVDAIVPAKRPRIQGTIDFLIASAGVGGGAMSGVVVAAADYSTLALCGGVLSLLLSQTWPGVGGSRPQQAGRTHPAGDNFSCAVTTLVVLATGDVGSLGGLPRSGLKGSTF